ncbi:MAG: YqeG family HAD IIIA-type phosphatase [Oscillatoriales cyanobacterium]|nr:MAG: YqeG family HAD IIIA-type phosphatase [Oscillatoriales cyanobacterium]
MKSWSNLLKPDITLGESILHLSPQIIQDRGLRGLVLDVDETLVPFRYADVSDELTGWLREMREHVEALWLVSNNINATRIGSIAESLDLPYIHFAGKPFRRKLARAVNAMQLPPAQVGMVGDRLLTDVLAGNRLGMCTILVEPMLAPGDPPRVSHVRSLETWISKTFGHR